jgi:proteasome assembly chaperone (PAC2) family protein
VQNEVVKRQKEVSTTRKDLAVVEMDELYTYIKKNLAKISKQESGRAIIPESGLLLIGTQAICLNLK